jgi:valyl-tRNA synthetase
MMMAWPKVQTQTGSKKVIANFEIVRSLITHLRAVRNEYKIEPVKKVRVSVRGGKNAKLVRAEAESIMQLARLETLVIGKNVEKPAGAVVFVEKGVEVFVELAGAVDTEAEKARIQKEIETVAPYVASLEKKLSNEQFVNNAPAAVVDGEKKKLAEAREKLEKLQQQMSALK